MRLIIVDIDELWLKYVYILFVRRNSMQIEGVIQKEQKIGKNKRNSRFRNQGANI